MPKDFQNIIIANLKGIYQIMANVANGIDDDNATLNFEETSIFNKIRANNKNAEQNGYFMYDNMFYNASDRQLQGVPIIQEPVSTNIQRQKTPEECMAEIEAEKKHSVEMAKADDFDNCVVKIEKTVLGKSVSFTFAKSSIENYIFENNDYFSDIPQIRSKTDQTPIEKNKLIEFNNMINWIINAGVEYGVDPNQIVAIIHRECLFGGTNYDASGKSRNKGVKNPVSNKKNGANGYMQITRVCIDDILGKYNGSYNYIGAADGCKKKRYGDELVKLLEEYGFNPNCPISNKKELNEKIWEKVYKNEDPQFNIKLGTLILRVYLNENNWDFKLAAKNYNGSRTKIEYARVVSNYYNSLKQNESKIA